MEYVIAYVIAFIIDGLIFGFAVMFVGKSKGYTSNWFLWGFFFGLIALIVALCQPPSPDFSEIDGGGRRRGGTGLFARLDAEKEEARVLADGGWKCQCGTLNAKYVYSCACGKSKAECKKAEVE